MLLGQLLGGTDCSPVESRERGPTTGACNFFGVSEPNRLGKRHGSGVPDVETATLPCSFNLGASQPQSLRTVELLGRNRSKLMARVQADRNLDRQSLAQREVRHDFLLQSNLIQRLKRQKNRPFGSGFLFRGRCCADDWSLRIRCFGNALLFKTLRFWHRFCVLLKRRPARILRSSAPFRFVGVLM
jgi:hypothetical protein